MKFFTCRVNNGATSVYACLFIGRVLNRFSKDIGFMDALLPNKLLDFITVCMTYLQCVNGTHISFSLDYVLLVSL